MSQVMKRRNRNRNVWVTDYRGPAKDSYGSGSMGFSGTRVGIASANCPKRRRARDSSSFAARRDVARPSKLTLHIGSTYGRNATHQAIQVGRL